MGVKYEQRSIRRIAQRAGQDQFTTLTCLARQSQMLFAERGSTRNKTVHYVIVRSHDIVD